MPQTKNIVDVMGTDEPVSPVFLPDFEEFCTGSNGMSSGDEYSDVFPKVYLYAEKMYIMLSLVAKSALGWQVFSGTLAG